MAFVREIFVDFCAYMPPLVLLYKNILSAEEFKQDFAHIKLNCQTTERSFENSQLYTCFVVTQIKFTKVDNNRVSLDLMNAS